jgi:hypothetical protein
MIVGIFSYYTLLFIYTLLGHKKGLECLQTDGEHEGDEFGKGCVISMVGLGSFTLFICLIAYIFY